MTMTAEQVAAKRGKEIFLVEKVNTDKGLRWAIVSHSNRIGHNRRIVEFFAYTPAEHERAVRIAKKFREDSERLGQKAYRQAVQSLLQRSGVHVIRCKYFDEIFSEEE